MSILQICNDYKTYVCIVWVMFKENVHFRNNYESANGCQIYSI